MQKIPKSHPRYDSLITREKIADALKKGLVHETGLIAHGRGEAFDYLLGEKTQPFANHAEKVSAAYLLLAEDPVISLNGNVVALVGKECISLANLIPAKLEINLFHRSDKRMKILIKELISLGAKKILGKTGDAHIPGLDHDRGICDKEGMFSSDIILVPLEDGDRCNALVKMGKKVIAIDLNPISRTAKTAHITIIDNVTRAIPNIEKWAIKLKDEDEKILKKIINTWDNQKNINQALEFISKRLNDLS
jgi:4-phosphopantoate--beta-alanine ligase